MPGIVTARVGVDATIRQQASVTFSQKTLELNKNICIMIK
jgi:hypothetical protein